MIFRVFVGKHNPLCIIPKIKTAKIDGRGVGNHLFIDSVVFRLPVFYNQQPPDILSGVITVQKHRNTNLTMLSHRNKWATTAPNPISWIQC